MMRLIAIAMVLVAGASQAAPPASAGSAPAPSAVQRQLHDTSAQIAKERAQNTQLKSRVSELEQRSTAQQAQQTQRDREIVELRRQVEALSGSPHHRDSINGHLWTTLDTEARARRDYSGNKR